MKIRTQGFMQKIRAPFVIGTVAVAGGALPGVAPAIWEKPKTHTFTVKAFSAGSILLTVGPLDHKKFKVGDRVKVTVQRIPKRRTRG